MKLKFKAKDQIWNWQEDPRPYWVEPCNYTLQGARESIENHRRNEGFPLKFLCNPRLYVNGYLLTVESGRKALKAAACLPDEDFAVEVELTEQAALAYKLWQSDGQRIRIHGLGWGTDERLLVRLDSLGLGVYLQEKQ